MVTPPSTLGYGLKSKQLRTIKQLEVKSQPCSIYMATMRASETHISCFYIQYLYIYSFPTHPW